MLLVGSGVLGVLGMAAFGWLFIGGDVLLVFVLGLPFMVFAAPIVLILASIPRVPVSPRLRSLALASAVFFLVVVAPLPAGIDLPLRLSFALHQHSLDAFADRFARATSAATPLGGERVGLFSFRRVVHRNGNLGLQVSGNDGGGQFLVRRGPGSNSVWINTNWEMDLGNGWWFVYQD